MKVARTMKLSRSMALMAFSKPDYDDEPNRHAYEPQWDILAITGSQGMLFCGTLELVNQPGELAGVGTQRVIPGSLELETGPLVACSRNPATNLSF